MVLATAKVPIDVRQVRINPSSSGQGAPTANWDDNAAITSVAGRLYDVTLELRGTVGLATPPNEGTVGLEPGQGDPVAPAEAAEKPAPAPKAALFNRPTRWRIAS